MIKLDEITKEKAILMEQYKGTTVKDKIKIISDNVLISDYVSDKVAYCLSFTQTKVTGVFSAFAGIVYQIDPNGLILLVSPEEWKETFPEADKIFLKYAYKKASHAYELSDNMIKNSIISRLGDDLGEEEKEFYQNMELKELYKVVTLVKRYGFNAKKGANYESIQKALERKKELYREKQLLASKEKIKLQYPFLKELTYKGMLEEYYSGFEYKSGVNSPKLSKQLSKQGIDYTEKELVYWGEVRQFFDDVIGDGYINTETDSSYIFKGGLWVDTVDMDIPDNVDMWAFRGSCNHSDSSTGKDTHLLHKWLGFSYLKVYSLASKGNVLRLFPYSRAYFYHDKDTGDLGCTGSYSIRQKDYNTSYEWTQLLLCVLFNKRLSDFSEVRGGRFTGSFRRGIFQDVVDDYFYNCWSNMHEGNDYNTYGTCDNILSRFNDVVFHTFIERQEDFKPIRSQGRQRLDSYTYLVK